MSCDALYSGPDHVRLLRACFPPISESSGGAPVRRCVVANSTALQICTALVQSVRRVFDSRSVARQKEKSAMFPSLLHLIDALSLFLPRSSWAAYVCDAASSESKTALDANALHARAVELVFWMKYFEMDQVARAETLSHGEGVWEKCEQLWSEFPHSIDPEVVLIPVRFLIVLYFPVFLCVFVCCCVLLCV